MSCWGQGELNKSARNEQRKLTATFFNAISSGTVLAALVAPFIGFGLGTIHANTNILNVLALSGFGLTVAFMVHMFARRLLKGLED